MRLNRLLSAIFLLMLLTACSKSPLSPSNSQLESSTAPNDFTTSQEDFVPITLTKELIGELSEAFLSGSFSSFINDHPDFLHENIQRITYNTGKEVKDGGLFPLLMVPSQFGGQDSFTPEDVLSNHQRLKVFFENCNKKIPDSIALLSSSSPVPLWITIYTFDGTKILQSSYMSGITEGDYLDVREYSINTVNKGFSESPLEWTLTYNDDLVVRYPKYGFIPRSITPDTLEEILLEGMEDGSTVQKTDGTQTLDNKTCLVYEVLNPDGIYQGVLYAVAQDFSRFYQVEQVNGSWLLAGQVAES